MSIVIDAVDTYAVAQEDEEAMEAAYDAWLAASMTKSYIIGLSETDARLLLAALAAQATRDAIAGIIIEDA